MTVAGKGAIHTSYNYLKQLARNLFENGGEGGGQVNSGRFEAPGQQDVATLVQRPVVHLGSCY